jgi:hypothetical protein
MLTIRGVNVQFDGSAWLVAYRAANAEARQPVVREISSHNNVDSS